jgi:hypothetical protein
MAKEWLTESILRLVKAGVTLTRLLSKEGSGGAHTQLCEAADEQVVRTMRT